MRVSAGADYAIRAAVELAAANSDKAVSSDRIAAHQEIPLSYARNILAELRRAGIVRGRPGPDAGFVLAKAADRITIADIIRAVDGPLTTVRGGPLEGATYPGAARPLLRVWIALRKNVRDVVERVTIADVASGRLPPAVELLAGEPEAWITR